MPRPLRILVLLALVGTGTLTAVPAQAESRLWLPVVQQPTGTGLTQLAQFGGASSAVIPVGPYVYLGRGAALVVLDVADPAHPREVAWRPTISTVAELVAGDRHVYVLARGVQIFDATDPAAPRQVAVIEFGGMLALDGARLYVSTDSRLTTYDVTDPAHPRLLGSWTYPSNLSGTVTPSDLLVEDGAAYLASGAGLVVLDVRDIAATRIIAVLPPTMGYLAVAPGWLFQATRGELHVYVRPNLWTLRPETSLPACDAAIEHDNGALAVAGRQGALVCLSRTATAARLVLMDLVDPHRPRIRGAAAPVAVAPTPITGAGLAMAGTYAFLAGGDRHLRLYDLADGRAPRLMAELDGLLTIHKLAADGPRAFVLASFGPSTQLAVVDLSRPAAPHLAGRLALPGYARFLLADGTQAVAVIQEGLQYRLIVVDASRMESPVLLGQLALPWEPLALAMGRDHVCLVDNDGRLLAVDLSRPELPRVAGEWMVQGEPTGVATDGLRAYVPFVKVPEADSGVAVVGLSEPFRWDDWPAVRLGGTPSGAALAGERLYVGNRRGDLTTLDLADPAAPEVWVRQRLIAPTWFPQLVAHGTRLATGEYDTRVYDLTTPQWPVPLGTVDARPYQGLALTDGLLLVAGYWEGLTVVGLP